MSDDQPSLWDRQRVTEEAIVRAEIRSVPWNVMARACIEWLCTTFERWTTDDFWTEMDLYFERPSEPRALGGPMMYARKQRWMVQTGVTKSKRATTADGGVHHTTTIPVFRSEILGRHQTLTWPPTKRS